MAKHTPGPWAAVLESPIAASLDLLSAAIEIRLWVSGPALAPGNRMVVAYLPAPAGHIECEANARLIAASPDLLEAAYEALLVIDACVPPDAVVPAPGVSRRLRAAIRKAEGDQ